MDIKNRAEFTESSYPNCINFKEIDLTFGCNAGCIYCSLAKFKSNAKPLSIDHLFKQKDLPKGIYLSPNSDPFDNLSSDLSYEIIKWYLPKSVPILINTKNAIPNKTIELLAKYKENVIPQISIARLDQDLTDYLEPHTSNIKERIETVRKLAAVSLPVRVLLIPLFPGIDDKPDLLEEITLIIKEAGAKAIKASYVVLRDSGKIKDNILLERIKNNPQLLKSYRLMNEEMNIHIGNGKIYPKKNRIKTYSYLNELCERIGIKFLTCTVLDPAMKELDNKDFKLCENVWKHQKEFLSEEVCIAQ